MTTRKLYEVVERDDQRGIKLNLHPGQRRAWESKRRIVAIIAGSQSGKTSYLPIWLHREIFLRGPGDYAFICPTFTLMELKALPEFRRLFETVLQLGTYTGSPVRRFTFSPDGAARMFEGTPFAEQTRDTPTQVFFGYAENPDSLESATYKGVVLDEAGQKAFKRGSWEAIQRRVALNQGRILIGTTPYFAGGWLKTEIFDRHKAGDPEVDLINFPSLANPSFPRAEYERAQRTLPAWKFNLFFRGVLDKPAGLIYDCFDDIKNTCPSFDPAPTWPRYGGMDFGGVNTAAVFLAGELGPDRVETGRYFAYREYGPCGSRTAKEHVVELTRGEPCLPTMVGGAGSEDQWRNEFAAAGLPVREPPIRDVEVGIGRVYAAIKTGKLLICDHLRGLLDELGTYSRELDDAGEPTEKIDNQNAYHLCDSLRYLCAHLFPGEREPWDPTPREDQYNPVVKAPPGIFLT